LVELVGSGEVVVMLEHAEEERFADAPRAKEKEVAPALLGALELGQKRGFVGVEEAFGPDDLEA
jgi:hypothetical protein